MSSRADRSLTPTVPRTVAEQFAAVRSAHGARRALWVDGAWWSFERVAAAADRVATSLRAAGAIRGDRVVIALPNSAIFRVLEQAALSHGFVRVAVSHRLHALEIAAIARDAGARVVCTTPELAGAVGRELPADDSSVWSCDDGDAEVSPRALDAAAGIHQAAIEQEPVGADELAMLMYSSGTTGRPKGATVTHAAWVSQTDRALAQLPSIGARDHVLLAAPMSHFAGSIALDCAVSGAATTTVASFDPQAVVELANTVGATVLPLAPVHLQRIIDYLGDRVDPIPTLRAIPYGGSSIPAGALARAARMFPGRLVQFYGLAEALAPLAALGPSAHDRAAEGWPDDRSERVLNSAGHWLAGTQRRESEGELWVKGPTVTSGYWRRDELTTRTLSSGWFRTGDIVTFDSDDLVTVLGRSDDVILSGGYNVSPGEVERALGEVTGVAELVVLGLPDDRWGEGVNVAAVVDHGGPFAGPGGDRLLLAELVARSRTRLAGYKKPVAVHLVRALPRNSAGKVDRRALRALLTNQAQPVAASRSDDAPAPGGAPRSEPLPSHE